MNVKYLWIKICILSSILLMILLACGKDKPTEPELEPGIHLIGSCELEFAYSVYVQGNYAYIMAIPGMQIISIADPSNPTIVGSCDTTGISGDIFVAGNFAYTTMGAIINVANPAEPWLMSKIEGQFYIQGIFVVGDYAYFSASTMALSIFDISDRTNPTFVSSYNTGGNTTGIWVEGSYAFLAYRNYIQILSIIDINNPIFINNIYISGFAREVCVEDDIAYVTADTSGLFLIDISVLHNSSVVGVYDTPGSAYWTYARGDFAYVADRDSGLQIIDVSDPANPALAGNYATSGAANSVFVNGSYIFLTDYEKLSILKFVP